MDWDEAYYSNADAWLPYRVVRPDEMLHPYAMGPALAALIMRSLRWLGDEKLGGYQMDAPRRDGYLQLANAFEDYLRVEGWEAFGVEPHPARIGQGDLEEMYAFRDDALERMRGLFEPEMYDSLWI
jgi:hypothetical protein